MSESGTERSEDPYQKICRVMKTGLLIMVNYSDPTTGIDEMKVLRVDQSGDVHLRAHSGEHFVFTHNDNALRRPGNQGGQ